MGSLQKKYALLSGWGNYPKSQSYLIRPESVKKIEFSQDNVIPRGLGRSYGDASLNTKNDVLLTERLNRFLSFDEKKGVLKAESGITLSEILEVFVPRGWFLPVTPGTKYVSLGGCVACDVHGKNHHVDGTFVNYVNEIELILADRSHKICSKYKEEKLFTATAGGMGLTGIITEISVQLILIETPYMVVSHYPTRNLDETLEILNDKDKDDKYSVAWIDCLASGKNFGRSIVMNAHHASLSEMGTKRELTKRKKWNLPFHFPSMILNYWTVTAFNMLYYYLQRRTNRPFFVDYDRYFYPLDAVENWNRLYGKRGFVQYQFVVPTEKGLRNILQAFIDNKIPSFLAVLKRFGPQRSGLLSFPQQGYTLALDIPIYGDDLFSFLDRMDDKVVTYGGCVYLAKDARLKPEIFRQMYPDFKKWLEIKAQFDPNFKFSSDLSKRLQMEKE